MALIQNWRHADGSLRTTDDALWGVYTRGPDEWLAAPSRKAAEELAHKLNAQSMAAAKYDDIDPWVWSVPDLWPFDPAEHEAGLELDSLLRAEMGLKTI